MYTLPNAQGILYSTPSCFCESTGSLGCTKCDLSVVLDLSEVRDTPITNNHGGTTLSPDEDLQCAVKTSRSRLILR